MTGGRGLFLSHDASRAGPPVVLRTLLRWMARHEPGWEAHVGLGAGGELVPDLAEVATVWELGGPATAPVPRPDLVVVNTAISVQGLRRLPDWDVPVVAVVHELDTGLVEHLPAVDHDLLWARARGFVAPAERIAANLVEGHGVDPARLVTCREPIEVPPGADEAGPPGFPRRDGRPVVVGAGVVQWRKGVDLFVALADLVRDEVDADFVWLGGPLTGALADQLRFDVAAAALEDRVHLVGVQAHPLDWLRGADLFVLPTREDSMPLVLLEAGSVGVPLVAFDVGGLAELVVPAGGRLASYPDVEGLAAHVVDLLRDDRTRAAAGATAREFVLAHHTDAAAAGLWAAILEAAA